MLEEEVGVMRNAMTTRAPCGAKNSFFVSLENADSYVCQTSNVSLFSI